MLTAEARRAIRAARDRDARRRISTSTGETTAPKDRREWTNEQILEALRNHVARTGRIPVRGDFVLPMPNERSIRRRFGTLEAAFAAAGISRRPEYEVDVPTLFEVDSDSV